MTDIRMLLHEAAPEPLRPLDMTALRSRARRRSIRRFATWVAGVGVVITAAVPTGGAFLVNAAQGDRDPTDAGRDSGVEEATEIVDADDPAPTPGRPPSDLSNQGSDVLPGSIGGVTGTTSTTTGRPGGGAPSGSSAYPLQSSCVIDNVGLGDGEQRRCRFTATTRGGADMTSSGTTMPPPGASAQVIVTRQGTSTTHNVDVQEQRVGELGAFRCGSFIEPGDLVEVILTSSTADPEHATITLGAGEGWECWNR